MILKIILAVVFVFVLHLFDDSLKTDYTAFEKAQVIKTLNDGVSLQVFSEAHKSDFDIVLAAVEKSGNN